MNKTCLCLLTLFATALVEKTACAQSTVTIYGVFDAGIDITKAGVSSRKRLISGGALGGRLGFRGAEDLGGGMVATFRLENGFVGDDGSFAQGGRAFGRESSVGLGKVGLGAITMGRIPTPVSLMQAYVDAFFWMGSGGLISLTRSSATGAGQLAPQVVSARSDNAINYVSPVWGGFELRALRAFGEGSTTLGSNYGMSARYAKAPFDLVAGFGRQNGSGPRGGHMHAVVVGGSYDFGPARVYVGYTNEKNACATCTGSFARLPGLAGLNASEFNLINLGVRVPLGTVNAIAQVVRVKDKSKYTIDPGNRDATWIAIGAEWHLSRRTMLYGALGTINNRNGSQYALGSGGVQMPANSVPRGNPRSTTLTLGTRHLF